MRKLIVKPRKSGVKLPPIDDEIQFNDARRLRNALLALANLDPGWMVWVEKNVPKRLNVCQKRLIVERQARVLCARRYNFLGWSSQFGIIYADLYFTDAGDLKTYL